MKGKEARSSASVVFVPEESTRWRFSDVIVGAHSDDIDDRGLICGVRSDGRLREGVAKLKLMLKISDGRRFRRTGMSGTFM